MSTNLPLRNRSDPTQSQVDDDCNNSNDPERLPVIIALVTENYCKDNPAKVACGTSDARYDA